MKIQQTAEFQVLQQIEDFHELYSYFFTHDLIFFMNFLIIFPSWLWCFDLRLGFPRTCCGGVSDEESRITSCGYTKSLGAGNGGARIWVGDGSFYILINLGGFKREKKTVVGAYVLWCLILYNKKFKSNKHNKHIASILVIHTNMKKVYILYTLSIY